MTAPRRRWFRFSLRTMLVVITLGAVLCAGVSREMKWVRDRESFQMDGGAWYFSILHGRYSGSEPSPPFPLRFFGVRAVQAVVLLPDATDEDKRRAKELFPEAAIIVERTGADEH